MAAPPLVFEFIGIVFTAILYGLYCLIFGLYWRIQLKRAERSKGILLYALTTNFILCTAYFIIGIIQVQFLITTMVLQENSLGSAVDWLTIAANSLYTAIDFISQAILIYRCWIMWRQPLVMVFPCLFTLAFLATALTTLGFQIRAVADNRDVPGWYLSAVTAFFFVSLGANALDTGLIVFKIISVYHDIRGLHPTYSRPGSVYGSASGQRDLYPLISILVESGLITLVAQLAQSIMYKFASAAFPLVGGVVVMLYGISMTAVLVRVELGVSYDHNTSRTANSTTNFGRHIPFTPVPSKLKQSI